MAAAIATLVRTSLRADFRRIDPTTARTVLVDRSKRILNSFSENLSEAALTGGSRVSLCLDRFATLIRAVWP
jgi:NADH dehydrogenase FAD-containing subunit